VRRFSTELILADRALRAYGPEADAPRKVLTQYVERALNATWPARGRPVVVEDRNAGDLLDQADRAIKALPAEDGPQQYWKGRMEARLRKILELRWSLIEESQGKVSMPFFAVLTAWLMLIFASFGLNAPWNPLVIGTFLFCTGSIAAALFLVIEMNDPFGGFISISSEPVVRALEHMRQ